MVSLCAFYASGGGCTKAKPVINHLNGILYYQFVYPIFIVDISVINEEINPGGGGGGTQMLFGRGCAAEASKPVPIFKGHFGGKGYPLLGVWRKRVPIIRGLAEKGTHY